MRGQSCGECWPVPPSTYPELSLASCPPCCGRPPTEARKVSVLERAGRGWRLRGTVLIHEAEQPIELRYAVTVDSAWATTGVEVLVACAGGEAGSSPTSAGCGRGRSARRGTAIASTS